jgi:DNA-binding transcriptional MocR family regulator
MIVVVIVYHVTRSVVGQKLALILSGEGLQEGCDLIHLILCQLDTALIDTHVTDSLFKSVTGTVMIIWPCMFDIAESRHLETVTVTFQLSFLVTSIVLICEFQSPVGEIMSAKTHEFI